MHVIGIIPARYASTRFPGKPLADIAGRPMILHVYERACRANLLDEVLVATDDERIRDVVMKNGGEAIMTSPHHLTGTDRLAEVARRLSAADIVVNVQGDEPLIDPHAINAAVNALKNDGNAHVSSVMTPLATREQALDPNVVKVVIDINGYAMYFSRSPIPYPRGEVIGRGPWRKHLGLYCYQREFLLKLAVMEPTPNEMNERLEQLRVLEHGYRIRMVERPTDDSIGVDTPEDLERVRTRIEELITRPIQVEA